jgi:hypothetical protein
MPACFNLSLLYEKPLLYAVTEELYGSIGCSLCLKILTHYCKLELYCNLSLFQTSASTII